MNTTAKIGDKEIQVDPMLLFQRMILCIENPEDVKDFFSFELAPFPLALFDQYGMRKTAKSKLYEDFKPDDELIIQNTDLYIIDGGFLLHKVRWGKKGLTFKEVCDKYVDYVVNTFKSAIIVFDGYQNSNSTKQAEHYRRYNKSNTRNVFK